MLVSSGQIEVLEQLKGEGPAWGPPLHTGKPCPPPEGAGRRRDRKGADRLSPFMTIQPYRWTSPACIT